MTNMENQGVSSLPLPPMQYINNYTDENIASGTTPKPPLPIENSNYCMFGQSYHTDDLIVRPLESQGIKRLHSKVFDHKRELKKLNHSILVNFLDLLDILISTPGAGKREEKINDMNLLFIHMHHLVNEYRPHQARETLRVMMEVQKRQRIETAERFQKCLNKVVELLHSCIISLPDDMGQLDCKIAAKVEVEESQQKPSEKKEKDVGETFTDKDKLMCNLVDSI
ncbi:mediator of RNA polymerase II transcription subunit 7-like [Saccoglossus kowalevskii]|uniref:Mediator of RNA polymerase II transcription subunit 7 n=1 Tax=Saccoglossus kowalevskii TaxID=10224 RepID=A0ABM0GNS7_SACKO|nr:PREDICTED: mediator of RNA polymerase II transcription subunit 7-like [Saccoglossus kowalevskii]